MKFLIIQTAFIGDVILATAVAEKLHRHFPDSEIHFVLRKGNEALLSNHPFIKTVFVWDKKKNKILNLFSILKQIRKNKYHSAIAIHRWASSGLLAGFAKSENKVGFSQNPLSFLFTKKIRHEIGNNKHEVERNQQLIETITDKEFAMPKLYPSIANFESVKKYKTDTYVCIAPSSVWFTKQFPAEKWIEVINSLLSQTIYLLGAPNDFDFCNNLISKTISEKQNRITNLCGKLNYLESAALMQDATMNYVNDSAPMHIASAMNAPVTAFYCSTIPSFGFGPLSKNSKIVETKEPLDCRPCGLHGHNACPKGHFKCGYSITIKDIIE